MDKYEYKICSGAAKMTKAGQTIDWSATERAVNETHGKRLGSCLIHASPYGLLVFGCGSQDIAVTFVLKRPRQP